MKKKKMDVFEFVKTYWYLIAILGFLISFSTQVSAIWKAPQKLQETEEEIDVTQKAIGDLSMNLNVYTVSNEAANKQRDEMLKLLTQNAVQRKK